MPRASLHRKRSLGSRLTRRSPANDAQSTLPRAKSSPSIFRLVRASSPSLVFKQGASAPVDPCQDLIYGCSSDSSPTKPLEGEASPVCFTINPPRQVAPRMSAVRSGFSEGLLNASFADPKQGSLASFSRQHPHNAKADHGRSASSPYGKPFTASSAIADNSPCKPCARSPDNRVSVFSMQEDPFRYSPRLPEITGLDDNDVSKRPFLTQSRGEEQSDSCKQHIRSVPNLKLPRSQSASVLSTAPLNFPTIKNEAYITRMDRSVSASSSRRLPTIGSTGAPSLSLRTARSLACPTPASLGPRSPLYKPSPKSDMLACRQRPNCSSNRMHLPTSSSASTDELILDPFERYSRSKISREESPDIRPAVVVEKHLRPAATSVIMLERVANQPEKELRTTTMNYQHRHPLHPFSLSPPREGVLGAQNRRRKHVVSRFINQADDIMSPKERSGFNEDDSEIRSTTSSTSDISSLGNFIEPRKSSPTLSAYLPKDVALVDPVLQQTEPQNTGLHSILKPAMGADTQGMGVDQPESVPFSESHLASFESSRTIHCANVLESRTSLSFKWPSTAKAIDAKGDIPRELQCFDSEQALNDEDSTPPSPTKDFQKRRGFIYHSPSIFPLPYLHGASPPSPEGRDESIHSTESASPELLLNNSTSHLNESNAKADADDWQSGDDVGSNASLDEELYSPVSDTIDSYFCEGETSATTLKPWRSSTSGCDHDLLDAVALTGSATQNVLWGSGKPFLSNVRKVASSSPNLRQQASMSSISSLGSSTCSALPIPSHPYGITTAPMSIYTEDTGSRQRASNPSGHHSQNFHPGPSSSSDSTQLVVRSPPSSQPSLISRDDILCMPLVEPSAPSLRSRPRSPSPPRSWSPSIPPRVPSDSTWTPSRSFTPTKTSPLLNSATLNPELNPFILDDPQAEVQDNGSGDTSLAHTKDGGWSAKKKRFVGMLRGIRNTTSSTATSASPVRDSPTAVAILSGMVPTRLQYQQISSPIPWNRRNQITRSPEPLRVPNTESPVTESLDDDRRPFKLGSLNIRFDNPYLPGKMRGLSRGPRPEHALPTDDITPLHPGSSSSADLDVL